MLYLKIARQNYLFTEDLYLLIIKSILTIETLIRYELLFLDIFDLSSGLMVDEACSFFSENPLYRQAISESSSNGSSLKLSDSDYCKLSFS